MSEQEISVSASEKLMVGLKWGLKERCCTARKLEEYRVNVRSKVERTWYFSIFGQAV
jgi:hypothetical protein